MFKTKTRPWFANLLALPALLVLLLPAICDATAFAATKVHTVTFGKWTIVPSSANLLPEAGGKLLMLKIRALLVDGRAREFTIGSPHDVTDRIFVVRRAFRINDSLPQEPASPHWDWQRGGWIAVDRSTGHVSMINLPDFDPSFSAVSWYRDYAAYWGASDDGREFYSLVAQLGRRKPIVKILFSGAKTSTETEDKAAPFACTPPEWQRSPARVTFEANPSQKRTYAIRGHAGDLLTPEEDEEEALK